MGDKTMLELAHDELARCQREREALRLWAEAMEKDWLTREQWRLVDGGMRVEQARIHAETQLNQAKVATIAAGMKSEAAAEIGKGMGVE